MSDARSTVVYSTAAVFHPGVTVRSHDDGSVWIAMTNEACDGRVSIGFDSADDAVEWLEAVAARIGVDLRTDDGKIVVVSGGADVSIPS